MLKVKSGDSLTTGEKFLFNLNRALNRFKETKLNDSLQEQLEVYARKIMEKRRKGKEIIVRKESEAMRSKQRGFSNQIIEEFESESYESYQYVPQPRPTPGPGLRPYYFKLVKEVFSPYCLAECVFDFLELGDLVRLRGTSKNFYEASKMYFPLRLQKIAESINDYLVTKLQNLRKKILN